MHFFRSIVCLTVAITLCGVSLGTSVKWSLYNSQTDLGTITTIYMIYAYQTLYSSVDNADTDPGNYAPAYVPIRDESWRKLSRQLIIASTGMGGLSLAILLNFSLIPYLRKKALLLNISRIISSVLSISGGSTLGYALENYKSKYRLLLGSFYFDPSSKYPDEDNLSTGFYMVTVASACLFVSAVLNTINIMLLIKAAKATVKPEVELTVS